MMTGDAYVLPISITLESGIANSGSFADVEVVIGGCIRKTMTDGEVTFDETKQEFLVPLTQEETFKLRGTSEVDLRLKFSNGEVIGVRAGTVEHDESQSRQVL